MHPLRRVLEGKGSRVGRHRPVADAERGHGA